MNQLYFLFLERVILWGYFERQNVSFLKYVYNSHFAP